MKKKVVLWLTREACGTYLWSKNPKYAGGVFSKKKGRVKYICQLTTDNYLNDFGIHLKLYGKAKITVERQY